MLYIYLLVIGTFNQVLYVDVIGQVADNKNPFVMYLQVIHSLAIQLNGRSDPVTVKKDAVFNPGDFCLIVVFQYLQKIPETKCINKTIAN